MGFVQTYIWEIATVVKAIVVPLLFLNTVPLLAWAERRGSAFIQDRWGPSRASILGFRAAGLFHSLADAVKFLTKEAVTPAGADVFYYYIAPALLFIPVCVTAAAIPLADDIALFGVSIPLQAAPVDAGVLFVIAVGSLGVYGIVLAGWSSGSKYSLLGGLRSTAQLISYESSLVLAVLGVVLFYGTLDLHRIVLEQGFLLFGFLPRWGVFLQPLGALLFLTAAFVEANRAPFDLPEGESEIVSGFHTEYSGMKFALFFMAEYMAMAVLSALLVTLYFGGWQVPWLPTERLRELAGPVLTPLLQIAAFSLKTAFFLWCFIWVRWTLPRFRYDQLMRFGWKFVFPLALANLLFTGLVVVLKG